MNQIENILLLTSRLYWKPPGEDGYVDFGNIVNHKDEPDIKRISHKSSGKGLRREDFALASSVKIKKSFLLDEHFIETINLLNLGNQLADVVQNAAVNGFIDIANADLKSGRVYDLGKQKITRIVVEDYLDNGDVVESTEIDPAYYRLDAATGMLTLLDASIIPNNLRVIFDCDEVTSLNFDTFSKLLSRGTFRQLEFDQHDEVPLTVQNFPGQVAVTAWGDNTGEKYNEFLLEVNVI